MSLVVHHIIKVVNKIRSEIKKVHIYSYNVHRECLHSVLALLDKEEKRRLMRVTYSDNHNFVIRYIPSSVHEETYLNFTIILFIALVQLTEPLHPPNPPGCTSVGATCLIRCII